MWVCSETSPYKNGLFLSCLVSAWEKREVRIEVESRQSPMAQVSRTIRFSAVWPWGGAKAVTSRDGVTPGQHWLAEPGPNPPLYWLPEEEIRMSMSLLHCLLWRVSDHNYEKRISSSQHEGVSLLISTLFLKG